MQQLPMIRDMNADELAEDEQRVLLNLQAYELLVEAYLHCGDSIEKVEAVEKDIEFMTWLYEQGQLALAKLKAGHNQPAAYLNGCHCPYCNHERYTKGVH